MKAATFLEKRYDLGITSSQCTVLTGCPLLLGKISTGRAFLSTVSRSWPKPRRGSATLREVQPHEHRHSSALRYVTPSQRHSNEAKGILARTAGRSSRRQSSVT